MSAAVNMFLVIVSGERRIPFEITANDPFYSSANMERLRRSAAQMEHSVRIALS